MNNRFTLLVLVLTLGFLVSCNNNDDSNNLPGQPVAEGILLVNEGNFGGGNASISALSFDLSEVQNNYYQGINGEPLGDTAQSMAFNGNLAFIVVNVSQTIEVVDRDTFESVGTVSAGLSNPRYMVVINGKGFVTNWGDGFDANDDFVAVINLTTFEVEKTIPVAEGPEEILSLNGNLYVAHQGGFSQNNIISIIDAGTESVTGTITVGDVPNSMFVDFSSNLWVLCGGKPAFTSDETAGALYKINTASNSTEEVFNFAMDEHPNFLKLNNDELIYFLNGGIYEMDLDADELPDSAEIDGLNIYNMNVFNSILYTSDAVDFVSNGTIRSYDINNGYNQLESTQVGIIPGEIYFE